ncbi:hypothetical protein [Streptomyces sp. IMTB 2501]|uniref:hypothetical protein n=1 Tax=Streptomyces sp. IMTB 2501 TaxID=1776340 RepID=UPI00117F9733|nr:hypothetical protein [Streptomyces sp. IMTB 2501]
MAYAFYLRSMGGSLDRIEAQRQPDAFIFTLGPGTKSQVFMVDPAAQAPREGLGQVPGRRPGRLGALAGR